MSCPTCGKGAGHWSNCTGPLVIEAGTPTTGRLALKPPETAPEDRSSREISEGPDVQVPPIQGDRCRTPDGREGTCFSWSPGKDNLAPWAFVDFGNEQGLEAFNCAALERLED